MENYKLIYLKYDLDKVCGIDIDIERFFETPGYLHISTQKCDQV